jgi:signal transduction histidine kinase
MGSPGPSRDRGRPRLARYLAAALAGWTVVVGASLAWNLHLVGHAIERMAAVAARASFEKDLVYRRWNAGHGGVYVPVAADTPPNPALAGVPGRDVTTSDGRRLTLINPAYMTRQVHELGADTFGVKGHITSLKPVRPGNAPDAWEAAALARLEQGEAEVAEVLEDGEAGRLRYLGRLVTEERCLGCHAGQGYRAGDVRGGIAVEVGLAPYRAAAQEQVAALRWWHLALWAVGAAILALGGARLRRRVAEREAALTALHEAEAQLAHTRRLEAIGQLAGGMAHDLNNMLAPVLSHAHGALEDLPPEHPVREDLVQIVGAGERARGVLRRLLAFGRKQPLEVRPADLAALVRGLLPMLRDVVGSLVRVEAALPEGLPPVAVDRGQVETALVNLAANARDAMPAGGVLRLTLRDGTPAELRAVAGEGRPRHLLALEVADTGAGMDAAVKARLFEPFFTTKAPGKGTGLGLASVHGVVKGHGGAVLVESAPGRGTTFRLLLPVAELEPEAWDGPGGPGPQPAAPSDSSSAAAFSQAP